MPWGLAAPCCCCFLPVELLGQQSDVVCGRRCWHFLGARGSLVVVFLLVLFSCVCVCVCVCVGASLQLQLRQRWNGVVDSVDVLVG